MNESFSDDVSIVGQIGAVPKILDVVARVTGMGFAVVARVTQSHWVACAVRDEIEFGLKAGGELVIGTTICDQIRQTGDLVVIEDVETDSLYKRHPTPEQYGFRSYISAPILLPDGRFFGTLCALDPRPAHLAKPEILEIFKLFANLIGLHLDSHYRLVATEKKLQEEREASHLREQFIAVLGHDLRTPSELSGPGCNCSIDFRRGKRPKRCAT